MWKCVHTPHREAGVWTCSMTLVHIYSGREWKSNSPLTPNARGQSDSRARSAPQRAMWPAQRSVRRSLFQAATVSGRIGLSTTREVKHNWAPCYLLQVIMMMRMIITITYRALTYMPGTVLLLWHDTQQLHGMTIYYHHPHFRDEENRPWEIKPLTQNGMVLISCRDGRRIFSLYVLLEVKKMPGKSCTDGVNSEDL